MTPIERHAELVYAESLFEKVSSSNISPFSLLMLPSIVSAWHNLFRRLAVIYQRGVRGTWHSQVTYTSRSNPNLRRLNMRTMISVYRHLGQYLDTMDAEARERGEPEDTTIDKHFRSGVYLGVGMCNIILSLMPAKLQTIVELFGYKGDRQQGLKSLMRVGGWSTDRHEPSVSTSTFPFPAIFTNNLI